MAQIAKASVVLSLACGASALVASGTRGLLASSGRMRPDVVAATLVRVEDQWAAQAAAFVDCSSDSEAGLNCVIPGKAFQKSCGTIVSAVVKASEGDRDRVAEYMHDVCKEKSLDAPHRARCQSLMTLMVQHMGGDAYSIRETFNSVPLCARFWEKVKSEEQGAIEQRRAAEVKAEAEQRKAEEEEIKRRQAEEAAAVVAAAKKAEEAAKAEQEAAVVAKVAEESAKKQVQEVAVASIAKSHKAAAKVEPKVEGSSDAKVAADGTQPKASAASARVVVDASKAPAPKAGLEPKVAALKGGTGSEKAPVLEKGKGHGSDKAPAPKSGKGQGRDAKSKK